MSSFLFRQARYFIGLTLVFGGSLQPAVAADEAATKPLPLQELRLFTEVFAKIQNDYVEKIDDKALIKHAVEGMLSGLDPHSAYLDKRSFKDLQVDTEGKFGGLGIEITLQDGYIRVVTPIDDTPAYRAGIKAGDIIARIDGILVKDMSIMEAMEKMRGEPGTRITLQIVREGTAKQLDFSITRAIIKITSIKSRNLEPGFGYVRITQFQTATGSNLLQAISKLKKNNKGRLQGLVLDLRNNPGGVLQAAIEVSDAFLSTGEIVSTHGRNKDSNSVYQAKPNDALNGAAMVVLINSGSASASEIVAGALQDQHRAVIMGTKSFGKGSVQSIIPLGDGAALKLTTARYYTPSGRSIQAQGIVPDIVVEDLKLRKRSTTPPNTVHEADLKGHLENSDAPPKELDSNPPKFAEDDFQLREALNLLKGIAILRE